ncbi:efflux RND transporter periplasmic adaptor subunit [Marinilabiliaceae bacterium ANBcel2]|nr:efflux RND transporter periplasmic adaptor subunit [Marinilabiliaceae bacterium ANBcel2]
MSVSVKRITGIVITIIIISVLLIPRFGLFDSDENETVSTQRSLPVTGVVLSSDEIENVIRSSGSLIAGDKVDVTAEISGMVSSIHFEEGSDVKKGDLLVSLVDEEHKAQLERAEYQRDLLEQMVDRQCVLLDREAVSQEEFDRIYTDYLVAQSEVKLLNTRLSQKQITAPFDGVAGFRMVSPGAYIQPGTPVTTLTSLSPLRVEFSIPERYQSEHLIGNDIYFTVSGFNDSFAAKVYAVNPSVEKQTRTLSLRALYQNEDHKLLPGMFANIRMVTGREENIVKVPSEAVIPQMDGALIFVSRNGVAEQVGVQTGTRTEKNVVVDEGLMPGDTVITSGILQLRTGMPVNFTNLD